MKNANDVKIGTTHNRRKYNAAGAPGDDIAQVPAFDANLLLRDFLQERWKGLTPILWGQQVKQERLDELIYLSVLNADHLPGEDASSPLTGFYRHNPQPEAGDA